MNRGHPARRLRNFLVDRDYQLRYALQMVAVSTALTVGLGAMIYHFNSEASRVVDIRAMDPTDETALALQAQFTHSGRMLVLALVGFGVLLALVLAGWQIVTTHKVAGPLFYISHQVKRIREGYLGRLHPLRKSDMLHGFFENFREMHAMLRKRAEEESVLFDRLADDAQRAGLAELAAELRKLQKQRESSLQ